MSFWILSNEHSLLIKGDSLTFAVKYFFEKCSIIKVINRTNLNSHKTFWSRLEVYLNLLLFHTDSAITYTPVNARERNVLCFTWITVYVDFFHMFDVNMHTFHCLWHDITPGLHLCSDTAALLKFTVDGCKNNSHEPAALRTTDANFTCTRRPLMASTHRLAASLASLAFVKAATNAKVQILATC